MTTQQILQGVHDWTNGKIVYDISAAHPDGQGKPTPYADLTAALGTGGANIPQGLRKGGMSVKFINGSAQGYDNKYMQYRLMADSWSINTNDWSFCGDDVLVENPEWIYVLLDAEKRILAGLKSDGSVEWSIGVPAPVKTYIANAIAEIKNGKEGTGLDGLNKIIAFLSEFSTSDTLKDLLDFKVDKENGKSLIDAEYANGVHYIENPAFAEVKLDSENKIIWAIKTDGSIYYGAGVPQQIINYVEEKLAELSLNEYEDIIAFLSDYLGSDTTLKVMIDGINDSISNLSNTKVDKEENKSLINVDYIKEVEDPEYIKVLLDNNNKIILAIKKNADVLFGAGVPEQIKNYVEEEIERRKYFNNEQYLRLLDVIDTYYAIEDTEERIEVTLDEDDNIISYRKKDGKKVENVGLDAKEIDTDGINFTKKGINKLKHDLIEAGFNPSPDLDDVPTENSQKGVKSGGVWQSEESMSNNFTGQLHTVKEQVTQELNDAIQSIVPISIVGDVSNAPDEEDITSVTQDSTSVLKLKDKYYSSIVYSGLGRVFLRKNIVNGVNLLTQDMFYKGEAGNRVPNIYTIFVIQYDYLLGENISIPEGCVLRFEGGSISANNVYNTITGHNTCIESPLIKIFNIDVNLSGSWNINGFYPEWYGAKGDGITDDTDVLNKTLTLSIPMCLSSNGIYIVSDTLEVSHDIYGNNGEIQIKEANVEYDVLHINGTYSVTNQCIIRDLQIRGKGSVVSQFKATGINIDGAHYVLDNCKVSKFKIGILVKKWSNTILNCHSVMNIKNLSMYASACHVNDVKVIGGNYGSPNGPYSIVIGDEDYSTYAEQGVRILLQGFCYDGGTLLINRVNGVTIQSIYSENTNHANNIMINTLAEYRTTNIVIRDCYLRGGNYGVYIKYICHDITVEDCYFQNIVYSPIYTKWPVKLRSRRHRVINSSGYPVIHTGTYDSINSLEGMIGLYDLEPATQIVHTAPSAGRFKSGTTIIVLSGKKRLTYMADHNAFAVLNPVSSIPLTRESAGSNTFIVDSSDIKSLNGGEIVIINGKRGWIQYCTYEENSIKVLGQEIPDSDTYSLTQESCTIFEESLNL